MSLRSCSFFQGISLLIMIAGASVKASAADEMATRIFSSDFKTLKVMHEDDFMVDPTIVLGGNDAITISFDEIGDDLSRLQYRLLHCNYDWTPSQLMESEYVDGFNIADIEDYAFSSNTYIHFVNYRFTIPSAEMKPLVSGNYIVQVFPQDDPDDVLLQARFRVTEQGASISGSVSGRTDRGINTEWQQLELAVTATSGDVTNPYTDLIVTVEQNDRPETRRCLNRPLRMMGSTLEYKSLPELVFPAGNEYRRFETVRTNYPGMGIDSTRYQGDRYHAWLTPSISRAAGSYIFDKTQRGRYVIDEYNSTDPELGADYVNVHFELDYPEVLNGDVYVEGALAGRRYDESNRMTYDRTRGVYTLELPLKQGSYNFQYVVRGRGGNPPTDAGIIEGNFAETQNEYNISVYLRTPASRADRLLGSATLLSTP